MELLMYAFLALASRPAGTRTDLPKVIEVRVTGYYTEPGVKSAIGEEIRPGGTAAVSPACIELLGERVYVKGHGVWRVNDLAAAWLDEKYGRCTLDLAQGSKEATMKIGNSIATVVRIGESNFSLPSDAK